ncbi:MAG TPA: hypothetical protein VNA15_00165 [Candidatus Angelobacter sp.]|nr:hypothetical protein [Candidatus Angelobacter sp.]
MLSSTLGITVVVGFHFIASAGSPSASKPHQWSVLAWNGRTSTVPQNRQYAYHLSVSLPHTQATL